MVTSITSQIALIGSPILHSRSPGMMNRTFQDMNVPYIYIACDVSEEKFRPAVEGLKALGFRGWNVTLPYKIKMMEYLDEIDESAKEVGAVNTVVNRDGKYVGYNTDGEGYLLSLLEDTKLDLALQRVVILGAGGAARSVGFALAKAGVQSITIVNRTLSRAEELAQKLSRYTRTNFISIEDSEKEITDATLLINATSVGLYPNMKDMPVPSRCLHPGLIVSDLVYNPAQTALLLATQEKGAIVHQGIGMLVYQAARAIEIWTGMTPLIGVMKQAINEELGFHL